MTDDQSKFAEIFSIYHGKDMFVVTFSSSYFSNQFESEDIIANIAITPNTAALLLRELESRISDFEEKYGKIDRHVCCKCGE